MEDVDGPPPGGEGRGGLDGPEDRVFGILLHGKDPHIHPVLPHEHGNDLSHPLSGPLLLDDRLLTEGWKGVDPGRRILGNEHLLLGLYPFLADQLKS